MTDTLASQFHAEGGPDGWKHVRLGDVVTFRREAVDPRKESELPYVGLEHIAPGKVDLTRWGKGSEVTSLKSRFYKNDVLYGKLRPYLDKAVIAPVEGLCSTDIIVLKPTEAVLPEFIAQILHTQEFTSFANSTTTGVNHPRTSWGAIQEFVLPLPPAPEQRQIAHVLSTIRKAQESTREIIAGAREMKKSLMASYFVNDSWPKVALGSAAQLIMGQSPPSEFYNEKGEGLPFLQGKAEFSEKFPNPTKYCTQKLKVAPKGSVLMSVRAPVGDVNLADREYIIGRGVGAINLKGGNNEFLFYLLTYLKPQVEALGSGTTFDSVNKGNLEQLEIPLPAVDEQERISKRLSAIDKKVEAEEARLNGLQGLYRTSLHELLSGKIRLPAQVG